MTLKDVTKYQLVTVLSIVVVVVCGIWFSHAYSQHETLLTLGDAVGEKLLLLDIVEKTGGRDGHR